MSELLQEMLINSGRPQKKCSWSSYSLSSGWIRFEGEEGASARGRGEVVKTRTMGPATMLANGFGRDIK